MSTDSNNITQQSVPTPHSTENGTIIFQEPVELYFDGAQNEGKHMSAIAFLLKDASGTILQEYSSDIPYTTSVQTELQALYQALKTAKELGINTLDIYGDCQAVINLVTGSTTTSKDPLQQTVQDTQQLLKEFHTSTATLIPREQNPRADQLSRTALDKAHSQLSPSPKTTDLPTLKHSQLDD